MTASGQLRPTVPIYNRFPIESKSTNMAAILSRVVLLPFFFVEASSPDDACLRSLECLWWVPLPVINRRSQQLCASQILRE